MKKGLFFLLFMVAFVFKGFSQSTPADSAEMYAYIDSVLSESRGPIKRIDFFNLMTTFNAYVDINASGGTGKLNISDTASMLSSYTRYVEFLDSISDLRTDIGIGGIQPGDTASMLAAYIQRSDTAFMLASYTRYAEFLDSISDLRSDIGAGAIQPSDTAAMLTPYISRSDTAAMLAPYSKFDGAYSSLTGKPQHEQLKTTTYITNNYTIQSSDSNKVFINNTTSNYTITINHNATTSWSKQQIEFRAPNTGYIRILVTNGTLTDGEANVLTADTIFIGGFAYLTSGTNWTIVNGAVSGGGGGGGTYSAGFGLDLAANVFSVDTTASGVATQFDIDSILSTKSYLTESDTASMLTPYINRSDTAAMLASYTQYVEFLDSISDLRALGAGALQLTDTAAMLQSYIQRSDTTTMLTPYISRSDTASAFAPFIERSDTATMLTSYIQRSDTATMLTPYINRNDTASMLSYYYNKTEIDSALISQNSRELNQNDTLKTADFGKVVYNNDATNDTLYIPTGLTMDKVSQFVGVESYGDGSVVIIEMSGVTLTDIENTAVDTTIMRATAIRCLGTNTYKILSKTTGEFGWAHYIDTAYSTAADSFYVAQGSTATLPIKADMTAALSTNYLPYGVDSLWSQFGNKIIPTAVGASYTVRVNFKAKNSSNTGYATLALDIGTGGTPNIVTGETLVFPKGAGVETQESRTVLLYSLDTFVANGCAIKITADTGNLEIYDISLMIRLDSTP